jgi:cobalamin biosynthesis Mg chelatase CobN
MRAVSLAVLLIAFACPARADLAPEPANPATPEGALVWVTVIAAVAALAAIWWRRRK